MHRFEVRESVAVLLKILSTPCVDCSGTCSVCMFGIFNVYGFIPHVEMSGAQYLRLESGCASMWVSRSLLHLKALKQIGQGNISSSPLPWVAFSVPFSSITCRTDG